jgi:hypothetical protein
MQYFYIYYSSSIPCGPHAFRSVEGLLWGAEPRFELWPALLKADAPEDEFKQKHRGGYNFHLFSESTPKSALLGVGSA